MPMLHCDSTPQFSTLVEMLRWQAIHQPHRLAYTFLVDAESQEACITDGELDRRARAIAARLQELGAAGQNALLLYPAGLDYIEAFFGCLYAGVVAIPACLPRPNRPDTRLQAVVTDAHPALVLSTASVRAEFDWQQIAGQELASLNWLDTPGITNDLADQWQDPHARSDSLALLQYTSGSTATPRGVMVSHGNILSNEQMLQVAWGTTQASTAVSWLPHYHDMGLLAGLVHPFYTGAACIFMSPLGFLQSPFRWLQSISRYKGRVSGAPNFAYDLCVRKITPAQRAQLDLSSWELAFNGAEPVQARTLQQFTEAFAPWGFRREAFRPCYGLAEATLFVSGGDHSSSPLLQAISEPALEHDQIILTTPESENARTVVSCGHTWLDQKCVIVNPETLRKCPPDRVGEIWVSGPNVAQGYLSSPEDTRSTFRAYLSDTLEGPFLRTGDLGFKLGQELFITGRKKDLIIIDGRNHYPQDIELTVEQSHSAIRRGCCAAFPIDLRGQECLVIVTEIDPRFNSEVSESKRPLDRMPLSGEIVQAVRRAVNKYHDLAVHDVLLVRSGSVPKTTSGKIQRRACRLAYVNHALPIWGG